MATKVKIAVNSVVDFKGSTYSVYGIVKSINNEKATLEFREPNRPQKCARCGSFVWLSVNGSTGEIECMATGCGHEHGLKIWTEEHPMQTLSLAPKRQPA